MVMKMDTKTVMAICRKCGEDVRLPEHCRAGEIVYCKYCGSEFEIICTNPPVLDWLHIQDYDTFIDDNREYS
jgi:lysine biosynthesis protein LysW